MRRRRTACAVLVVCIMVGAHSLRHLGLCSASTVAADAEEGVLNTSDRMCGPHCLWLACRLQGKAVSLEDLIEGTETSPVLGTSVEAMVKSAEAVGLWAEAVETDVAGLRAFAGEGRTAILLVNDSSHYVAFDGEEHGEVWLLDGTRGRFAVTVEELRSSWGNVAVVIGNGQITLGRGQQLLRAAALLAGVGVIAFVVGLAVRSVQRRSDATGVGSGSV